MSALELQTDGDLIDAAMGIISNVDSQNGQGWEAQSQEWQDAAREWLNAYALYAMNVNEPSGTKEPGE